MPVPLVSIAIPAYRHAAFIEECLASVYKQTYPELELVLIDDGSPDNTFEIASAFLEKYKDRFRRIVLERNENRGVSANSNTCIERCRGEWVHLLGSDDVLYPDKVESIQNAIAQWDSPRLALVYADADIIDEHGKVRTAERKTGCQPLAPDEKAYRWLFYKNVIPNPTVALRRSAFLQIGGFNPALPLEDIDCWLRLAAHFSLARVPETLACYRKHPGNSLRQRAKMLGATLCAYADFLEAHPTLLPAEELPRHFRKNVWRVWRRSRKQRPWLFPQIACSLVRSYFARPGAEDYRCYGRSLLSSAGIKPPSLAQQSSS